MQYNLKPLYDTEIALLEHEVIGNSEFWDWKAEDAQMYLNGVHDMAQRIIEEIQRGLGK